jgi:hypothetical protein
MITDLLTQRFWEQVQACESGCLEWTGTKNPQGYGRLHGHGRGFQAHRYSYELHFGDIPPGVVVCHRCDNPSCVNADHLFLGTQKDNVDDCREKGRFVDGRRNLQSGALMVGERHPCAKLAEADVLEIRRLHAEGKLNQREAAARYGVAHSNIHAVVHRIHWKHL